MPTVYIQVQVLAADQAAAIDYLSDYGSFPLNIEIVPYSGDDDAPATNYGNNISCAMNGALDVALQNMPNIFTGCSVQTVQRTSPYWKAWLNNQTIYWNGWLQSQGLKPRVVTP